MNWKLLCLGLAFNITSNAYATEEGSGNAHPWSLGLRANAGSAKKLNSNTGTGTLLTQAIEVTYKASEVAGWVWVLELGRGTLEVDDAYYGGVDRGWLNQGTKVDLPWIAVAKAGYATRLGQDSLAVFSLGLGSAGAEYEIEKVADTRRRGTSSVFELSCDAVVPLSQEFALLAGANLRAMKFKLAESEIGDKAFQTNAVGMSLGARYSF